MVVLSKVEFRNAVTRAAGHPWRVELRRTAGAEEVRPQLLAYDHGGMLRAVLPVDESKADVFDLPSGGQRVVIDLSADLRVRVAGLGLTDLTGTPIAGPDFLALDPLHAAVTALDGPLAGRRAQRPALDDGCVIEVAPAFQTAPASQRRKAPMVTALAFLSGTDIDTDRGPRPIQTLAPGDLVRTRDQGDLPVRIILRERHDPALFRATRELWPVRIARGALGFGAPRRDLWVAQGERLLFSHIRLALMFDGPSAMVRAKSLAAFLDRVEVESDLAEATYYHVVLDRHAVIYANGAEAESMAVEPAVLPLLADPARDMLCRAFPDLAAGQSAPPLDFPTLRSWEVMAAVA